MPAQGTVEAASVRRQRSSGGVVRTMTPSRLCRRTAWRYALVRLPLGRGGEQHQVVVRLGQRGAHRAQQAQQEGVVQALRLLPAVPDQPDRVRAAAYQRAGRFVRRVPQLARQPPDTGPGGLADLGPVVERPRDGGCRYAAAAGEFTDVHEVPVLRDRTWLTCGKASTQAWGKTAPAYSLDDLWGRRQTSGRSETFTAPTVPRHRDRPPTGNGTPAMPTNARRLRIRGTLTLATVAACVAATVASVPAQAGDNPTYTNPNAPVDRARAGPAAPDDARREDRSDGPDLRGQHAGRLPVERRRVHRVLHEGRAGQERRRLDPFRRRRRPGRQHARGLGEDGQRRADSTP